MKGKWSLNRLLHNNKLMIIFSIISAIAIWGSVHVMSKTDTLTITNIPVKLDLSGTYAGNDGLRIFSGATQQAEVTVSGSWLVISRLTPSDIKVTGSYDDIRGAGKWTVKLNPAKNSIEKDYEIVSINPQSVDIQCDYLLPSSVKVEADITGVSVEKTSGLQLGTPVIEAAGIENSTITIEGPKNVVSKIVTVKAKVDKPETISKVTTFVSSLIALDADGNPVNTENCTYVGLTNKNNKVNVTVPVLVHRTVNFTYELVNMPEGFKRISDFVTVSPASIELVGSPEQVESFADTIANLGTFDFNHMNLSDAQQKITLNIPQGMRVLDGTSEATAYFNMKGFTAKIMNFTLTTQNTKVTNLPTNRSWSLSQQKIKVTLIGNSKSIEKIKESNLSAIIDMENDNTTGSREHRALIHVTGYDDIWVYYGETEPSGYIVYLTIQ